MGAITFSYRATTREGTETRGVVEAPSKEAAFDKLQALQAQGLRDVTIEHAQAVGPRSTPKPARQKGLWLLTGVPILLMIFGKLPFPTALGLGLILGIIAALGQLGRPLRRDEKVAAGILGVALLVAGVSLTLNRGTRKAVFERAPSAPATDRRAAQAASDQALAQIMHSKFHDLGVERVQVDGPVMTVHVTRDFYRMLFTNRLEGNQIIRQWQAMVAKNYSETGVGLVTLYSENHLVAETDKGTWSDEVKIKWTDD